MMSMDEERRNCDPSKIKAESCHCLSPEPIIETPVFAIIHSHATILFLCDPGIHVYMYVGSVLCVRVSHSLTDLVET